MYKYEQVVKDIIQQIENGTYSPGSRLPSLRDLSEQLEVSISTVTQAYYLLEARGWVKVLDRSGFYVRNQLPNLLPEPDKSSPLADPSRVSMRTIINRIVHTDTQYPDLVQLGAAHPNPELSATTEINCSMRRMERELTNRVGMYDYVPGLLPLRIQIARRSLISGCQISPDEVIITTGCTEAINLSLRAVCQPGDTVAIESPMVFDTLLMLDILGLKAVEIPTHPRSGMDLDALEAAIKRNPISAVIVISNFNNPLGSSIPEESKRKLAELVNREQIPLIENEIFGELYFGDQRPKTVKAFDRDGWVILCSSFSKSLAPGYRVGWVLPGRFQEMVEWLKYTTSLASPTLAEYGIADFMDSGRYQPYLRKVRREYARRMSALSQSVRRFFPAETRLTRPKGGFVLWVELPESVDALEVYYRALEAGTAITPGHLFSASDQYQHFIRLNAANWSPDVDGHIKQLGQFISGDI